LLGIIIVGLMRDEVDEEGLVWFGFRACVSGTASSPCKTTAVDGAASGKSGGSFFKANSVGTTASSTVISLLDIERLND
jgi:hypothetical protein